MPEPEKKLTEQTDEELMDQVSVGDVAAYCELLNRYQQRLKKLSFGILRNLQSAEDATQTALMKVWEHRQAYKRGFRVSSWLYAIVRNEAFTILRRRKRQREVLHKWAHDNWAQLTGLLKLDQYSRVENADQIAIILERLPKISRDAIRASLATGNNYSKMAKQLGGSRTAVGSRLTKARKQFRAILDSLK